MRSIKTLKVILADDETLVKVGLKSLASWDDNCFEIIAEAGNGEEALELIGQHRPHLLITDIMMPKMDGIELIRRTRELYPEIRILVLSSYDEYRLVREAMKLGASDYLLKLNINRESMDEVLLKIREDILSSGETDYDSDTSAEIDPQSKLAAQQDLLRDVVSNIIPDRDYLNYRMSSLGIELSESSMYLALIETNLSSVENKFVDDQDIKLIDFVVEKIVSEIANEFFSSYFIKWSFGAYLLLFSTDEPNEKTLESTHKQILMMSSTIIDIIKKYANLESAIGISRHCSDFLKLPLAYKQALMSVSDLFYKGYGQVIFSNEAAQDSHADDESILHDFSEELVSALQLSDASSVKRLLSGAQNSIQNRHLSKQSVFSFCSQIVHLTDFYLSEGWKNYQRSRYDGKLIHESLFTQKTIGDIVKWLGNFISALGDYLSDNDGKSSHAMISKSKNYISENKYRNISLTEVADNLGISSSYLSSLFSKYTGMSFTEYVNKVKIIEAQKMIRKGNFKIYEISYQLGYDNACYFSKIFKKITGMTPTDYLQNSTK